MKCINKSVIVISAAMLLQACGATKGGGNVNSALAEGMWQEKPVIVDGDCKDWPSPYPNYDSKAKIAYATSNDAQYLYITMQTGDDLTQLKILRAGMTVSIDTSGKKNGGLDINYPQASDIDPLDISQITEAVNTGAGNANRIIAQTVKKNIDVANQYGVEGLKGCNGGYMVGQNMPCGIKVKAKIDEYKELVWELAIPFKAIYGFETLPASYANKPISVGFSIKSMKQPKGSNDNVNNNVGSSMNGTAGMMQGGSRPGGGINNGPLAVWYTATKTWKQFKLAYK